MFLVSNVLLDHRDLLDQMAMQELRDPMETQDSLALLLLQADLDLSDLAWAKSQGTVRNLRDRRFDLYKTVWTDGG